MTTPPLIRVRDLGLDYPAPAGPPATVLDDISLDIDRGEFVALTGPSGSGKSTLLYCLSGLESPTRGVVEHSGVDLATLTERRLAELRRTSMGFVFQQTDFLDELDVLENILLPAPRASAAERTRTLARVEELMERLGIAAQRRQRPRELSGGQRQRAGICRALVNDPALVFADEPTGALHSEAAAAVIELFTELNSAGTAIVLVTHDETIARRASRRCRLTDGRLLSEAE